MTTPAGPLAGLRVLELGHFYMAPYAGVLLAHAGADVVKIEPPGGEHLRFRGSSNGATLPFAFLNSNKRGICVDLKSESGRETFLQLVDVADVLIENYAPGVMDRLDISGESLLTRNPRLVYVSGSGYGTGAYSDRPAVDITIQAFSGVMSITGYPGSPPLAAGVGLADFMGGTHMYGAAMTALYERERTGRGQITRVALLDSVLPSMASSFGLYQGTERVPQRRGNGHAGGAVAPYNVYQTADDDGWIAIMCFSEAHWQSLIRAMGRPELGYDPSFANGPARAAHVKEVDEIVGSWTRGQLKLDVWATLYDHKVPSAPVRRIDEVLADPDLYTRGMFFAIEHPEFGRISVPHSPLQFDDHPPTPPAPSPTIGQHNDEVLADWLRVAVPASAQ